MRTIHWKTCIPLGLVLGGALLLSGCATNGYIIASVQSLIGLDVSENPKTQVPHIRFGYARSQYYYIPTGLVSEGTTPSGWASDTPDLISEIGVDITPLTRTLIRERFAVGPVAVVSGAARTMFAPAGTTVPTVVFKEELSPLVRQIRILLQDPNKLAKAKAWINEHYPDDPNKDNPDAFLDKPPEPAAATLGMLLKHLREN